MSSKQTWSKPPPPPPLEHAEENSSIADETEIEQASVCFSDEDDTLLWYSAMRGDRQTLERNESETKCLEFDHNS